MSDPSEDVAAEIASGGSSGWVRVAGRPIVDLTDDEASLITAALAAYAASIEHAQVVILGADVEAGEVKKALRRVRAKFFQVNRPDGRRF